MIAGKMDLDQVRSFSDFCLWVEENFPCVFDELNKAHCVSTSKESFHTADMGVTKGSVRLTYLWNLCKNKIEHGYPCLASDKKTVLWKQNPGINPRIPVMSYCIDGWLIHDPFDYTKPLYIPGTKEEITNRFYVGEDANLLKKIEGGLFFKGIRNDYNTPYCNGRLEALIKISEYLGLDTIETLYDIWGLQMHIPVFDITMNYTPSFYPPVVYTDNILTWERVIKDEVAALNGTLDFRKRNQGDVEQAIIGIETDAGVEIDREYLKAHVLNIMKFDRASVPKPAKKSEASLVADQNPNQVDFFGLLDTDTGAVNSWMRNDSSNGEPGGSGLGGL